MSTTREMLEMSDDDIMNMVDAPELEAEPEVQAEAVEQPQAAETVDAPEVEEVVEEPSGSSDEDTLDQDDASFEQSTPDADKKRGGNEGVEAQKAEPEVEAETPEPEAEKPEEKTEEVDFKAAYEKIMAPFKANGRDVKLNSPEEVVQLLQMGANYTKKMQALQPNLKLLRMLENNGLLDENRISHLIDLDKKDPKAIQKLVKDAGIDPMDLDNDAESDYKPGNYTVSEEEVAFTTTLEEVTSRDAGKKMVMIIKNDWDEKSKDMLWKEPNAMRVVTDHKESGVYDQISAEVERRKILGDLGNVPFLEAYLSVGQELHQKNALNTQKAAGAAVSKVAPASPESQPSRIVDTRPAAPRKSNVSADERVRAASPTKASPGSVKAEYSPLSMSDEEFEKNASLAGRL
jgi:hypothetical protein